MAAPGCATHLLPNFLGTLGLGLHDFETGSVLAKQCDRARSRSKKKRRKRLLKRLAKMLKRVKSSFTLKGDRDARLKSSKSSTNLSWQSTSDTSSARELIPVVSVVLTPPKAKTKAVRNPTMNRAPARFLKEAPSRASISTDSSSLNKKSTERLPDSEQGGRPSEGTSRPSLSQRFFMPERRATDMDVKQRLKNALPTLSKSSSNRDKHRSPDSDTWFGTDAKLLLRHNTEDVSPKAAKLLGLKGKRVGVNEKVERVLSVRSVNTRSLGSGTSRPTSRLEDNDDLLKEDDSISDEHESDIAFQGSATDTDTQRILDPPARPKMAPVWLPRSNTDTVLPTMPSRNMRSPTPQGATPSKRPVSALQPTPENIERLPRRPPALELPKLPLPLLSPLIEQATPPPPPLPTKNPERGLLLRRARIIDGVPFDYENLPLPSMPVALVRKPSSICSEHSSSTSVAHESNFHWDKLNVARPDSGTLSGLLKRSEGQRLSTSEYEDVQARFARFGKVEGRCSNKSNPMRAQPPVHSAKSTIPLASIPTPLHSPSARPRTLLERLQEQRKQDTSAEPSASDDKMGLCHSTLRRSKELSRTSPTSTTLLLSPTFPEKRLSGVTSLSSGSSRGSWYGGAKPLFTSTPISNPTWIAPLDPFEDHVYLVIGEALHAHNECGILRLRLPCALLAEYSLDLRARIEANLAVPLNLREPVRLPVTNPCAFEIYLQWLYHGNLQVHMKRPRGKHAMRTPEVDDVLKAWEIGRDLLDSTFQDACTNYIHALARERNPPPLLHVHKIYDITTPESGLRRLFHAMMCEEKLPLQWRRDEELGVRMLGQEAYEAYKLERRENGKVWDKRKLSQEGSWRGRGCQFHEHDGVECGVSLHMERLQIG